MALLDLRGSNLKELLCGSSICCRSVRRRKPVEDPTPLSYLNLMSASKVQSFHTLNIFLTSTKSLASSPSDILVGLDRKIYKYIHLLVNRRQQLPPFKIHPHKSTMALPVSSALDNILRHEANSVRFRSEYTPSLSNAFQLTLAGKLLSSKKPSISNMILFASRTWEFPNRLMCYDHGKGLFSFEFINHGDVERVVAGGPWYINGDLLLITRMDPNLSIEQLPFTETKLRIRCYDLPPMCFILEFARIIGNGIGKFCDTDLPPEDPTLAPISIRRVPTVRKYLRVKVSCSLSVPLKRTQLVEIENPRTRRIEEKYSRLAYETLPMMCYRCGFLGHTAKSCLLLGPIIYGDWIRADKFYHSGMVKKFPGIPEGIPQSPSKKLLKGESSRPKVVTSTAELITTDSGIIHANYREYREAGVLPQSKGKSPMIELHPFVDPGNSITQFMEPSNSPPSKMQSPKCLPSLLGAIPSNASKPPRPVAPSNCDTIIIDSEECALSS